MDGAFLVLGVGLDVGAGWERRPGGRHRVILDSLEPWATSAAYLSMADEASTPGVGGRQRRTSVWLRIRQSVDPHGLFLPPHRGLPSPD